jgi:hypothetical protein
MSWKRADIKPMCPRAGLVEHGQIVHDSGDELVVEAEQAKNIELARLAERNLLEKVL